MTLTSQQVKELVEYASQSDEIRELHRRYGISADFISNNLASLVETYPDQYVAVGDGQILAHGKDIDRVLSEVDRSGYDRTYLALRFISKNPRRLVL